VPVVGFLAENFSIDPDTAFTVSRIQLTGFCSPVPVLCMGRQMIAASHVPGDPDDEHNT
jgi:hypothetical protein